MKNSLIFTARIFRNTSFPIVSRPYFNQTREMSKDTVADSIAATKVEYKRLGSSGLRVSVPIFGCMSFGSSKWAPWVIEEDEALPLLKYAYDKGLNSWDTANIYSNGESEKIIAKAIEKYQIPRQKLVIMTKLFAYVGEGPDAKTSGRDAQVAEAKDYVNQGGLSRGAIFNAIDASLERLNMPYVDLLQIHRFDKNTPIDETMKALHDIVQSGKVRYIGASSMFAWQFALMQASAEKNGWTKFVSMQNHYSALYREEEREMNPLCQHLGVGLIPWGPLNAGRLARPASSHKSTSRSEEQGELTKVQTDIISRVEELAKKKGWTMSQVALAWIQPQISSPIIGFSSEKRIDEAIEAKGKTLSEDEIKYINEPYEPRAIEGHA